VHRLWAVRRHQEGHGVLRRIIQLRIDVVIGTLMVNLLASPELAYDSGGFHQALGTLWPFWPRTDGYFFIQGFARADAEKSTSWVEQTERGEGFCHDCGVIAQGRASDGSAHRDATGPLPQGTQCDPCKP